MRRVFRSLLQSAGLLDVAREARGFAASFPWLRDNSRYWLNDAPDGLPVPPLRLVRSSTGTSSLRWYFHGGALAGESIVGILAKNGVDVRRLGTILDFGCGCGRVIRHWAALPPAIHGCDYNMQSVRWCQRNLTFANFATNELTPPLLYADERFDLVYALSVFTHLPESLAFAWLGEMQRVLKPGGWLIISTHGDPYLGELTADQRDEFRSGRAVVRDAESAGTNRCGVYCSEEYIRREFARGFRVADFVPQGAKGNPPQDLVLLQRS